MIVRSATHAADVKLLCWAMLVMAAWSVAALPVWGQEISRSEPLWSAPGDGQPLELTWTPAGGQFFLHVRPSELLQHDQAQLAIRALGPRFAKLLAAWEQRTQVELTSVRELLVVFVPHADGRVTQVSVVHLDEQQTATAADSIEQVASSTEYRLVTEPGIVVFGPQQALEEIVESGGEAFLSRPMNAVRSATDTTHHFTMLFAPSFVLREAQDWFPGDLRPLKSELENLLTEDTQACSVAVHFGEHDLYTEARLLMTLERRRSLRHKFVKLADAAMRASSARLETLAPVDPHWAALAARFGSMVDYVRKQTRFAWEQDQAIINVSLPGKAAHNLLLAGELLLAENATATTGDAAAALSLLDMLKLRVNYTFSQQSFDNAFLGLAREVNASNAAANLQLRIVGDELKKAGVTRNQDLTTFAPGARTVGQLLTLLAMQANPSQVTHPSDPQQVIVWTVGPDPKRPESQVVLITTRQAATEKELPLPKYFRKK
jgi:hypothetical protein